MKEMELNENNNNINIIINNNDDKTLNHNKKESVMSPLESYMKHDDNQEEKESGTVTTSVGFLYPYNKGNSPIDNLNKSSQKTEDTSNLSKSTNERDTESFYQKTKRWAGTVWSYIDVRNYFPKTEYLEYRNANGDMVKVPKKKLPLKKKKQEENEEDHIVNRTVDRDRDKASMHAADNVPLASHFF